MNPLQQLFRIGSASSFRDLPQALRSERTLPCPRAVHGLAARSAPRRSQTACVLPAPARPTNSVTRPRATPPPKAASNASKPLATGSVEASRSAPSPVWGTGAGALLRDSWICDGDLSNWRMSCVSVW